MNKVCLLSVPAYGCPYSYMWKRPLYHDVTPPSTDFTFWCKNSVIQYALTTIIWNPLIVHMTKVGLDSVSAYGYSST